MECALYLNDDPPFTMSITEMHELLVDPELLPQLYASERMEVEATECWMLVAEDAAMIAFMKTALRQCSGVHLAWGVLKKGGGVKNEGGGLVKEGGLAVIGSLDDLPPRLQRYASKRQRLPCQHDRDAILGGSETPKQQSPVSTAHHGGHPTNSKKLSIYDRLLDD